MSAEPRGPVPAGPPRAVLWCDFGGVLTPPIEEAIDSIVAATGIPWRVLYGAADAVAKELGVRGIAPLELGLLSQAEWGRRLTARLAPRYEPQVDLARWGDYWYRDRPANLELVDELERLARSGTRIGLLTNSVVEWEPHRARMLGATRFDGYVRSHEVGLAKPDRRIFEHADTVLPPGQATTILIDDTAENCAAARRHGWIGIHHVDTTSTISTLRALLG